MKSVTTFRPLVLLTILLIIQQVELRPPAHASIRRTDPTAQWMLDTESGVTLWIGLNS